MILMFTYQRSNILPWLVSNLVVVSVVYSLKPGMVATIRKDLLTHPNWRLLDPGEECGLSSSDRIIGGSKAHLGQYPWMARLGYSISPNLNNLELPAYTCGATIINNLHVLTAAHCCPPHIEGLPEHIKASLIKVRLGEFDSRSDPDCLNDECAPPVQDIPVLEHIVHPGYAERQNDICLVRLSREIQFSKYVLPICLPAHEWFRNNPFEHYVMEAAGWGVTNLDSKKYSDVLMAVKMAVVPDSDCAQAFLNRATISERQLCAGAVIGKDSCVGDSGGPLMAPLSMNGPPRYYLVGIVSFGEEKCATKAVPGVYTRVSQYLPWILDNIHT